MRRLFLALGFAFVALIVAARLAAWQSELWWFQETGYAPIYLVITATRWTLFLSGFALWLLILGPHFGRIGDAFFHSPSELSVAMPRTIRLVLRAAAVFLAACGGWWASLRWMTWLAFFASVPVRQHDAILGRDLAFWLFRFPAWQWLWHFVNTALWLALLAVFIAYNFSRDLIVGDKRRKISPRALRHLAFLGAGLLVWQAVGTRLIPYELLLSQHGAAFGGGWTDVRVRMPLSIIAAISALLGALALWRAGVRGDGRGALRATGAYAIALLGLALVPILAQRIFVAPDETRREAPFIAHNIAATRRAYALDAVREEKETEQAIARAAHFLAWPEPALLAAINAREAETNSGFLADALHLQSYKIGAEWRPIVVAAREPDGARGGDWQARHAQKIHGDGLWLCDANRTEAGGAPLFYPLRARRELFFADFPEAMPQIDAAPRRFAAPSLSPIAPAVAQAIAPTNPFPAPHADYVILSAKKYARFQGDFPGVAVRNAWRKRLLALGFGDAQLAANATDEDRIVWHRRVLERCRTIAPFLWFPENAVPIVAGSRVVWLANGFTASRFYPQSQPQNVRNGARLNYLRHAVVATVDAFDGRVRFYIADARDPILATFARVFPDVFWPLNAMPADVRRHLRYPATLLRAQAEIWTRFHTPDSHSRDADSGATWRIADVPREGFSRALAVPMQPQFSLDENGRVHTQILFSANSRGEDSAGDSVVAALGGSLSAKHDLMEWRPAKSSLNAFQAGEKTRDAPELKALFDARDKDERLIWRGDWNLAVGKEPLWAQGLATAAKAQNPDETARWTVPRLEKVAFHFRNRVWIAASHDEALAQIARAFAGKGASTKAAVAPPIVLQRAREQFGRMQKARGEGDWTTYESAEAELKRLLETP